MAAIRRKTRRIMVGAVALGGSAPVSIQSMIKVPTTDVTAVVRQVKALETAGCEIVRVAVKSDADARAIRAIRRGIRIPLVADIHFDHRLALAAIEAGCDKVRVNPGNMKDRAGLEMVVRAAKRKGIPIRIGINSGSIDAGRETSDGFVKAARSTIAFFERLRFRDIVISLKASTVADTILAYRKMAALCDYPLHLGVTASGPGETAVIKSAIGIGSLLVDGIGDTIRVSLTADPVEEIRVARTILQSAGRRVFGHEIISCPTCGRCQVDLMGIVKKLEGRMGGGVRPMTIAVMGCEVNGPGEAKEADIGIAAGKGSGALFVKGRIVRRVAEKDFIRELLKLARKG